MSVLTVPEVAAILRIGKTQAYELVKAGVLPTIPHLRSIRVPSAAVDALVASATAVPSSSGDGTGAAEAHRGAVVLGEVRDVTLPDEQHLRVLPSAARSDSR